MHDLARILIKDGLVKSAHDCSEGGLAVALAESCLSQLVARDTPRLIGAVVMVHGDDQGLKLPPRIAPVQAVVVPIWRKEQEKAAVLQFVARVKQALGDRVRLLVDDRDQYSPGWKYNEHELRGVPIRLEVGPRDVAQQSVMSVRRFAWS